MKPIIRDAVENDIDGIYRLSCRVHLASYSTLIPAHCKERFTQDFSFSNERRVRRLQYYLPKINDPRWHIRVAIYHDKLVGYVKSFRQDAHTILKKGLFVDPEYQGRGIGEALFKDSLTIARSGDTLYLSVIKNNERARRLYEAYGFKPVGDGDEHTFYGARLIDMMLMVD